MDNSLRSRNVVLLGAGHTNAHILRMWRMKPVEDANLICVSNAAVASYSGMLPGTLAGLYEPDEMLIDLVRLCRSVGATLIRSSVCGLEPEKRLLLFSDRPPLPFDVLSVGIGSQPGWPGDIDRCIVAIKPMQTFLARLRHQIEDFVDKSRDQPLRVAIVGGGIGGIEITFCLPRWLDKCGIREYELTLIDRQPELGRGLTPAAANSVRRLLAGRGVKVQNGTSVDSIIEGRIRLSNGESHDVDLVILATSASAPPLLEEFALPLDPDGFLLTEHSLRTTARHPVFAVGDCGTIEGTSLPKAGVYAVRQGPVLWANIQRQLAGRPLTTYRPQRNFLRLLCTGDGRAVASYWGVGAHGRWCWTWKDWIDRRFMRKYVDYAPMSDRTPVKSTPPAMRCVGCGGKVSGQVLSEVLKRLDVPEHPSVLQGLTSRDDAAVLNLSDANSLVATVDFFAPPT